MTDVRPPRGWRPPHPVTPKLAEPQQLVDAGTGQPDDDPMFDGYEPNPYAEMLVYAALLVIAAIALRTRRAVATAKVVRS